MLCINTQRRKQKMQEHTRTPAFQETDGSWSHLTKNVNPLICTIEYGSSTGFSSEEEARESYHNSIIFYQNQLYELKKNRNVSFTFSEYLDYWFRDIYTPSSRSSSTLIKYQWVLYEKTGRKFWERKCSGSEYLSDSFWKKLFTWTSEINCL